MSDFDDEDRRATQMRDISELLPAGLKAPRHPYVIVLSGREAGAIFRLQRAVTEIGRGSRCDISLADEGMSRRHARLLREPDGEVRLEDLGSTNGTWLGEERIDSATLRDGDRFQLGDATLLKFSLSDEFEEGFQRRLYEASTLDALTGTHNRKYFDEHLSTEVSFARRHATPLALLLLDIDHFKGVNDTYGHLAGDEVLRELGALLLAQIRSHDTVARYGGEEFAVLARGITPDQAATMAARLRDAIERHVVRFEGVEVKVTASIGLASLAAGSNETDEDLLAAADRALYKAKESGRNRVESE